LIEDLIVPKKCYSCAFKQISQSTFQPIAIHNAG
jgi:hypothetical protein